MPRFRLRSWQTTTLHDSHDFDVDVDTIDEAARLLAELQDTAQTRCENQPLPNNIESAQAFRGSLPFLNPDTVIGSERGMMEIDADGKKLRDIPEVPGDHLQSLVSAIREIIRGSRATGRWIEQIDYSCKDGWHDSAAVPDGHYDIGRPPMEDIRVDHPPYPDDVPALQEDRLRCVNGVWLRPARWKPYDSEEQTEWLQTVVRIGEQALAAVVEAPAPAGKMSPANDPVVEEFPQEWSGHPDPTGPDSSWIDDNTGACMDAATGERLTPKFGGPGRSTAPAAPDLRNALWNALDLSTSHITEWDMDLLNRSWDEFPRTARHAHGAVLFVSGEAMEEAERTLRERQHSEALIQIYRMAASLGSRLLLINFDQDAATFAGLPTYDW